MSLLQIRMYPDPVLRAECEEVQLFDDALHKLADDMIETMYAAPGVGLAAPQIGESKQLAVVDASVGEEPDALMVLVNPRIVDTAGSETDIEGCLSIADFTEKIDRPSWIKLEAQDLDGSPFDLEAEDFTARAICHEIDHLNGVLFVDHLRGLRRDRAKRHLRRLAKIREAS